MYSTPDSVFKDAVTIRTYSRELPELGRKESVDEIFNRVLDAFEKYYGRHKEVMTLFYDRQKWFRLMKEGYALPAGRMLWIMGSKTVEQEGFLPMMNCSFVAVDDPISPLLFTMKMLILGCGVGFSLEKKHFHKVQTMFAKQRFCGVQGREVGIAREDFSEDQDAYVVEDSREGWVDFLERVVRSAIFRKPLVYTLHQLRPAGSLIKGFGGRSADPSNLERAMNKIYWKIVSEANASVTMYYDVICLIAEVVVSGNVRRSALIAIGDPDDSEFLNLKRFDRLKDNNQRAFCNNSVNVSSYDQLGDEYWSTYDGSSEAYGWVNTQKSAEEDRQRGRGSDRSWPIGFNPCGEQPLANREVCCLGEVNLSKCVDSREDFYDSLNMVYLFCKLAYTLGAPTERGTELVCSRNQRIGVSLTGISMIEPNKLTGHMLEGRYYLEQMDKRVSRILNVPESIALTTVKPGGTLPKIAGSSGPGIHRPISQYQIRRVRFAKHCALLKWFKEIGVPVEPQYQFDGVTHTRCGTQVASFYLKNQVPADRQFSDWQLTTEGLRSMFEKIAHVQSAWSENSISVTVYYNLNEVESVLRPMMREYFPALKTFSGLPYFGHNFLQAPEQPITESEYEEALKKFQAIQPKREIPLDVDGIDYAEDFGQCESVSSCSDR